MKRKRHETAQTEQDGKRRRGPLTRHPLFAAVLGLWGAALGGLVTLVLPRALVLEACAEIGLARLDATAPFVLAAIAALVLGGALYAIASRVAQAARKARRRKPAASLAAMAVQQVRTIDPVKDLGIASLDEPVETMPFAGLKPVLADEDTDADAPFCATQPSPPAPLELDLAEFGALPGRNAVWVEGPEPLVPETAAEAAPKPEPELEPDIAPVAVAAPVELAAAPRRVPPPVSPSAIERLRSVPTSELSLVQMVERFAAALHEHQSAPPGHAGRHADQARRDAALAEALKALTAFSPDSDDAPQGDPLRAALSRLQELRGAA
jgi:hypothetical protein